MTTIPFPSDARPAAPERMHLSVQILSTIIFGAFAITAVALAFAHFWPAGVALAAILGWRGGFVPQNFTQANADEIVDKLRALGPEAARRSSGNASFDAYRAELLQQLEQEQDNFDTFLERLRTARDKHEFDSFMEDRARAARSVADDAE